MEKGPEQAEHLASTTREKAEVFAVGYPKGASSAGILAKDESLDWPNPALAVFLCKSCIFRVTVRCGLNSEKILCVYK